MRIDIMTLFPESLTDVLADSILGRAQERGYLTIWSASAGCRGRGPRR